MTEPTLDKVTADAFETVLENPVLRKGFIDSYLDAASFHFEAAKKDNFQGHLELAINQANACLLLEPNQEEEVFAYQLRGMARFLLNRLDEAYTDFLIGLQSSPTNLNLLTGKAIVELFRGTQKAVSSFTEILERNPDNEIKYTALIDRAASYYRLEQYEKAIDDLKAAIEIHPQEPWAHALLGDVLLQLKGDSKASYLHAIHLTEQIPPRRKVIWDELAALRAQRGLKTDYTGKDYESMILAKGLTPKLINHLID